MEDTDKVILQVNNEEPYLKIGNDHINVMIGNWTMVYDEGFDILVEDYSFFAFSKYAPQMSKKNIRSIFTQEKKPSWVSMCYSTLIGWYHKGDYWGCFYAEKQNVNSKQITNNEVENKLVVVEDTVKSVSDDNQPVSSFIENKFQSYGMESLTSEFKNHHEIVEKINSAQNMWEATLYSEFSDMTLKDLNKFAGRKKHKAHTHGNKFDFSTPLNKINTYSFLSINTKSNRENIDEFDSTYPSYPKNFSKWVPYMTPPRNQGQCGSCYAVATINMLEARLKIKYDINERLSLDHVLKCSVYNQGCEGGYSYLVMKFGNEIELIPEKCKNENSCEKKCINELDQQRVYKVQNYKYLGGSYGKCSEELLMKELSENGPVVVSFEPDYHFMMYRKGVYKSPSQGKWVTKKLAKPEWEKVDHSVTLVGWGYDEELKVKYWLLLNSWGKHWGEDGYFKMVRGSDHMGIESICEVGDITYVDM